MGKAMFNEDRWKETLREFGWTRYRATDIDVFCERRGNFFIAEFKPADEEIMWITMGQDIALRALARTAPEAIWVYYVAQDGDDFYIHQVDESTTSNQERRTERGREVGYPIETWRRLPRDEMENFFDAWFEQATKHPSTSSSTAG